MLAAILLIIGLPLITINALGQNNCLIQKYFLNYLFETHQTLEAKHWSKKILNQPSLNCFDFDSVKFNLAGLYIIEEKFDSSRFMLNHISSENLALDFPKKRLMAYSLAKENDFQTALKTYLNNEKQSINNFSTTYYYGDLGCLYLLNRNLIKFDSINQLIKHENISLSNDNLNLIAQTIKNRKKKSKLLAGGMSAIVPGLGKVYAGKPYQGLTALFFTTSFALQAYEGYKRNEWKSPRLYAYGALFTVFYLGNIYGSYLSIQIGENEWNDKINHDLLFHLTLSVSDLLPK